MGDKCDSKKDTCYFGNFTNWSANEPKPHCVGAYSSDYINRMSLSGIQVNLKDAVKTDRGYCTKFAFDTNSRN